MGASTGDHHYHDHHQEYPPGDSAVAALAEEFPEDNKNGVAGVTRHLKKNKAPKGSTTTITTSFPPNIFSIMRYGHEVIRGNMKQVNATLEEGDLRKAKADFRKLMEWGEMHKLMEEGHNDNVTPKGFFTALDERFENVVVEAKLREAHDELEVAEAVLHAAMETDDLVTIQNAFSTFQAINEAHLLDEEAVMMVKVAEMKANGVDLVELMTTELLALVVQKGKKGKAKHNQFKFFVQHANRILQDEPEVTILDQVVNKATVFDQALWACATPNEWKEWKKWIAKSLKRETYQEVIAVIKNSA